MVANFWSERVCVEVAHRNGLHSAGVPHPSLTAKALASFTPTQQKVLARHIVGAFQSAASRRVWSGEEEGMCPACGAPEDKWHRFSGTLPAKCGRLRRPCPLHCQFALSVSCLGGRRSPGPNFCVYRRYRLVPFAFSRVLFRVLHHVLWLSQPISTCSF